MKRSDEDFEDEIRAHLELEAEQRMREGARPREAWALAHRAFGNVTHVRERFHESHRARWIDEVSQDIRYAIRQMRRSPILSTTIILTLALGVGANALIFGVIDRLLLRAPPGISSPARLRRLYFKGESPIGPLGRAMYTTGVTPYAVVPALAGAPTFSGVAGYFHSSYTLGRGADARRVDGEEVSGNYFEVLGVRSAVGRLISSSDERSSAGAPVAVLSYGFWRRQFGGSRDVIGKSLHVDDAFFTVIGVAPAEFNGVSLENVDVWMPVGALKRGNDDWKMSPNSTWISSIARLAPGATDAAAAADATLLYRRLLREWQVQGFENGPDTLSVAIPVSIITGRGPDAPKEARLSLWLGGVAAIVLLIACANVANLLLARAIRRRRETAVRLALGIGRSRLVRQLIGESLPLATIATAVAFAVAIVGARLTKAFFLPTSDFASSLIDGRVAVVAISLTIAATVLAAAIPALQSMRIDFVGWLTTGTRESARRSRLQLLLIVAQTSLSTALLISAGLFVRSLQRVRSTDVGVDLPHVLLVYSSFEFANLDSSRIRAILSEEVAQTRRVPGVTLVTLAMHSAPKAGATLMNFEIAGRASLPALPTPAPFVTVIDRDFFRTLGARILLGRGIQESDEHGTSHVAVVNEMLAQQYWPHQSPIGACLIMPGHKGCTEVVGVVQNIMGWSLTEQAQGEFYLPRHPASSLQAAAIIVRTNGDASTLAGVLRNRLQSLSSDMPYVDVRSYQDLVEPDLRPWRLGATLFSIFGALAGAIAIVGLYGVLNYSVSQRTREIGIRMALGAGWNKIVWQIASEGVSIVAAGVLIGVACLMAASHFVGPMLYHTSATDPQIIGAVASSLFVVALLASAAPARRAARVEPTVALRDE